MTKADASQPSRGVQLAAPQRSPQRLLIGAVGLLVAAAAALLQPPWPDAERPPPGLQRLLYPLELQPRLRLPQVQGQFNVLCAEPAGERLWAAGSGGLLLVSRDGGASWRPLDWYRRVIETPSMALPRKAWLDPWLPIAAAQAGEPPREPPPDVRQYPDFDSNAPALANLPAARKNVEARKAAKDAPQEQRPQLPPLPALPAQPTPLDPDRTDFLAAACNGDKLWLAGSGGVLLHSSDGGERWRRQPLPTAADLRGIAFADAERGWLLGADGHVYASDDGGASWVGDFRDSDPLYALALGEPGLGWAVGSGGKVMALEGGWQWSGGDSFFAVAAVGARAWAVGANGRVDELTWPRRSAAPTRSLVVPPTRSVVVPQTGTPLRAVAAGGGDDPWLWVAGDGGLIRKAKLEHQPLEWENQDPPQRSDWRAILALDAQRAWIAGADGRLLRTIDGGAHWIAQTRPYRGDTGARYLRLPAPWFFLLAALLLTWANARVPAPAAERTASVADLLVSDRPLRRGDANGAALADIAAGLSRFLRNDHTEPPLTLAITGRWGSGKSSLMNLLRDDLSARGFRPVWFNAWHHQKGEQLLASLFAAIKRQAVPPLLSVAGLTFRLRLLGRRGWQHWFATSLMLLFLAALAVYLWNRPDPLAEVGAWTQALEKGPLDGLAALAGLLVPGGLALPPLVAFVRSVRAFRLNPAVLMHSITLTGKDSVLNQQPAARSRFAEEFADVTDALGDFRLVLFIDDLDRCEALHVVEVLEAVSFLVSSGNCFIVLGMDDEWVQTCVGLAYEDIAEEHAEALNQQGKGPDQRRRFARGYLEKLVNIEVPVPPLSDQEARQLIAPEDIVQPSRWARGMREVLGYAPWLLVLLPLWLGVQLGQWLQQRTPSAAPQAAAAVTQPASGADARPARSPTTTPAAAPTPTVRAIYREGQNSGALPRALVLLLVIPAALYLLHQLARHQAVTQDSREFRDALALWQPWLTVQPRTPRALKRFLNRLRYIAMRDRREPPLLPWSQRLRRWLRRPPPVADDVDSGLPESTLVALCAIHDLLPKSLAVDDGSLDARLCQQLALLHEQWRTEGDAARANPAIIERLLGVLTEHAAQYPGHWPPTPQQLAAFVDILASAQVR